MNKPAIFIIGTAKAGTTWLYECLKEHPDVLVSSTGEVDYFSYYYNKGQDWYLDHFKSNHQHKITVDITPSYLTDGTTPERIFKFNPESIIVLVVRNPIDRAYSHYCMHYRAGIVSANVDEEINEESRYLQDGLYFKYVKAYEKWFPKEQIVILSYDKLYSDPRKYFNDFCNTVSIDNNFIPTLLDKKYHARKGKPKRQYLYKTLINIYRFFAKKPHFKQITSLFDSYRKSKHINIVHQLVKSEDQFPAMSPHKRQELQRWFKQDLQQFEKWANMSLAHWLKSNNE